MDVKEKNVDIFLKYLNEVLEEQGQPANTFFWNFASDSSMRDDALSATGFNDETLFQTINTCLTRGLLRHAFLGGKFDGIELTERGQGRALSVNREAKEPSAQTNGISIGSAVFNAPTQIGNGNSMSFENVLNELSQAIENSNESPTEKEEAKSRLKRLLEHPLVASIIGGAVSGLVGKP